MRFAGNRQRRITCQLQDAPVGLGRQMELVFCFLYVTQAGRSHYSYDAMPDRLADGYGF
jgi:hypothetical protein